jgi:hypothetical protein
MGLQFLRYVQYCVGDHVHLALYKNGFWYKVYIRIFLHESVLIVRPLPFLLLLFLKIQILRFTSDDDSNKLPLVRVFQTTIRRQPLVLFGSRLALTYPLSPLE